MANEQYYFLLGGVPIIATEPEIRKEQAQALIEKYLNPKVTVEKLALKFELKDWLPVILGIGAFILVLRLIK
jgi:hypothetical protein